MRVTTDGPEDGAALVWILGWGNRFSHGNVEWLRGQFADAGYHVHTFQIPDVISDFRGEYVEPIQKYLADIESFRLVGHSTGGLIAPYLDGATTTTYLSPWWGFPEGSLGLDRAVLSLLAKIPTRRKILFSGRSERAAIGELATDAQMADGDPWAAPTFFREALWAHEHRPAIDPEATVFCTPRDPVVSVRAIAEAVSLDQIVFYEGGHEWFSSPCRETQLDTLLSAVE